jgi:hypothetical protein
MFSPWFRHPHHTLPGIKTLVHHLHTTEIPIKGHTRFQVVDM